MAIIATTKYDITASITPSNQNEYIRFRDGTTGAGIPYGISSTTCNIQTTKFLRTTKKQCQGLKYC